MSPELLRISQADAIIRQALKAYLEIYPAIGMDQLVNLGFGFRMNETKNQVLWVKTWSELDEDEHRKAKPQKSVFFTVKPLNGSSNHNRNDVHHGSGQDQQFRSSRGTR